MAAGRQRRLLPASSRAPDLRLPLLDGGEASLPEILSAGPAVLAFFKVTCPVCQFTLPFLDRLHGAGALQIYGISQNDADDTRELSRDLGLTMPMMLDTEESGFPASNAFGISSVPTVFLVERGGAIARVIEGWSRKDVEALGLQAGVRVFHKEDNVPEWKAG